MDISFQPLWLHAKQCDRGPTVRAYRLCQEPSGCLVEPSRQLAFPAAVRRGHHTLASTLGVVRWYLIFVLTGIFLVTYHVKHPSVFTAVCTSSVVCPDLLPLFKLGFLINSSLYVWITNLYQVRLLQTSCPSVWLVFSFS